MTTDQLATALANERANHPHRDAYAPYVASPTQRAYIGRHVASNDATKIDDETLFVAYATNYRLNVDLDEMRVGWLDR